MDFASSAAALQAAFDAAWAGTTAPAVPGGAVPVRILHDNEEKLDPPPNSKSGEAWVRFAVVDADADARELSSRNTQDFGRVVVAIFTKLGTGDVLARQLASKVRDIFQQQVIGGVICRETRAKAAGATPDNTWFQVNAWTPFEYESTPV